MTNSRESTYYSTEYFNIINLRAQLSQASVARYVIIEQLELKSSKCHSLRHHRAQLNIQQGKCATCFTINREKG